MSLSSEAPILKITPTTVNDISNELLGAALCFCEETGYRQNVTVLTFFWSSLLLADKRQLDLYNLFDDVMAAYPRSLSQIFSNIDSPEIIMAAVNRFLDYFSRDPSLLFSAIDDSKFFQIAHGLNSKFSPSSYSQSINDQQKTFLQITSNASSNIYRILYQIECQFNIQYKNFLLKRQFERRTPPSKNTGSSSPLVSESTTNKITSKPQSTFSSEKKILFWMFILFVVVSLIGNIYLKYDTEETPSLVAVQEPKSGTILFGKEFLAGSKLTISAASGESCVVKLKNASGATRLSFYVRAGDTVTVGVPTEKLYVYFATGKTWYGKDYLFGKYTSYSMDDEIVDFKKFTMSYTLYPVSNGNFSETPIKAEDF